MILGFFLLEGPALFPGMVKYHGTGNPVAPETHCATPVGRGWFPGDEVMSATAAIDFWVTVHIFVFCCIVAIDKNIDDSNMPYYQQGPDDKFSSNFFGHF